MERCEFLAKLNPNYFSPLGPKTAPHIHTSILPHLQGGCPPPGCYGLSPSKMCGLSKGVHVFSLKKKKKKKKKQYQ